jgi:hypothetical protein
MTASVKSTEVIRGDRADGWTDETLTGLSSEHKRFAIKAVIPLHDLYRWTPHQ